MNPKSVSITIILFIFLLSGCNKNNNLGEVDVPDLIKYNNEQYSLTSVVYKTKGYPNTNIKFTHNFTDKNRRIYIDQKKGYLYIRTKDDLWIQYKD